MEGSYHKVEATMVRNHVNNHVTTGAGKVQLPTPQNALSCAGKRHDNVYDVVPIGWVAEMLA